MNELLPKDERLPVADAEYLRMISAVNDHVDFAVVRAIAERIESRSIASDRAHERIEFLEEEVARWKNAHAVVMIERDQFKLAAEMNRQTIIGRASAGLETRDE